MRLRGIPYPITAGPHGSTTSGRRRGDVSIHGRTWSVLRSGVLLVLLALAACNSAPDAPTTVPQAEGLPANPQATPACKPRCTIATSADFYAVRPDSAASPTVLGFATLAGGTTTDVRLRIAFAPGALASRDDSVRIIVDGDAKATLTLRDLESGFSFRPLADNDTATVGVLLVTRRTGAHGGGQLLLETDASLIHSSVLASARGRMAAPNVSLSAAASGCPLLLEQGTCGTTTWQISPFVLSPNGGFQSGFGTGASATIVLNFSQPITSITVTAIDPTWQGNKMTATGDNAVETATFEFSNQPGLLVTSTRTLVGAFTSVRLEPAPGDYVLYEGSITVGEETFTVKCEPATVTRGARVVCSATLTPANTFTLARREAKTTRLFPSNKVFKITDAPALIVFANGQDGATKYEWAGAAAENTEVTFVANRKNAEGKTIVLKGSASYAVQPRAWPQIRLDNPVVDTTTLKQNGEQKMITLPSLSNDGGILGLSGPDYTEPLSRSGQIPIDSGPNKGLALLRDPVTSFGFSIWMHPGQYNLSPSQQWFAEQDSTKADVFLTIGSTTQTIKRCGQRQFRTYVRMNERHEGVTLDPGRSHWGIYSSGIITSQLHLRLESVVHRLPPQAFGTEVSFVAYEYLKKELSTSTDPSTPKGKNKAFDNVDYDAIKVDIRTQEMCFPFFYP